MQHWSDVEEFDEIKLLVTLKTISSTSAGGSAHVMAYIEHSQGTFENIFGYRQDELPLSLLAILEKDNPPEVLVNVPRLLSGAGPNSEYLRIRAADGRVFSCHLTFASQQVLRDGLDATEGTMTHVVSVVTIRRAVDDGGGNLRLL